MGFVHVRNAIQHGLGRLTDQQLGKYHDEVLTQIRASSVELNGDLLVIVADDVHRCGKTCGDFIMWLDAAYPKNERELRPRLRADLARRRRPHRGRRPRPDQRPAGTRRHVGRDVAWRERNDVSAFRHLTLLKRLSRQRRRNFW